MLIKLFDVDPTGAETFRVACDHSECFPDDLESAAEALHRLRLDGFHIVGGGAAPLVRLVRDDHSIEVARHWFQAADDIWSDRLRDQFGGNAGDVRYTARGKGGHGSALRAAYDEFARTRDAWHRAVGLPS